jgi:hypothetical protein
VKDIEKEPEVNLDKLADMLAELKKEVSEQKNQKEDVKPKEDEVDYSAMTPDTFANNLRKSITEELMQAMTPILKQVAALTYHHEKGKVQSKDNTYDSYAKEVEAIIIKHPDLSLEDALLIAKGKNPPKTMEEQPQKAESMYKSVFQADAADASDAAKDKPLDDNNLKKEALSAWNDIVGIDKTSIG